MNTLTVSAATRLVNRTHTASHPAISSGSYPDAFTLHPALRAFLGQHILASLGALLILQPHWLYSLTGWPFPSNPQIGALILGAIALSGAALALVSVTRVLWAVVANSYVIDSTGVEQVQWYFSGLRLRRRCPRVHFSHLRAVDVEQSVLQMLLGVGTVRLASGGTDRYEIDMRHISRPRALRAEFQRRVSLSAQARPIAQLGDTHERKHSQSR